MLLPEECRNMGDIRGEIDRVDRGVIALLGERYRYVSAASRFKASESAVRAPERLAAMLVQRREWAVAESLDPDVIEKLYADLVAHFVDEEMKRWKSGQVKG